MSVFTEMKIPTEKETATNSMVLGVGDNFAHFFSKTSTGTTTLNMRNYL